MHLFTSVVQPLWGLPQFLDMISKAEAVEYRYWIGRYKLTAGNVQHVRNGIALIRPLDRAEMWNLGSRVAAPVFQ